MHNSPAMSEMPSTRLFLGPADPAPVEWVNGESASPLFLVCEHAGQAIPAALGGLGLPPGAVDRHIGWDIGAEALARALAARLDAPLVLQRYSRLVIDCNRPPEHPSAMPAQSDGQVIPGNAALDDAQRQARIESIVRGADGKPSGTKPFDSDG